MARDYIEIGGTTPASEDCAQVGSEDYQQRARGEAIRFIELIRRTLGDEPEGAYLAVKSNPHDFGSYLSVVCYFDDENDEAQRYALGCDEGAPTEWGDTPAADDVVNPDGSPTEYLGLPIFEGSTETVKSSGMPHCDFCMPKVKPVVDGRTKMGPWAAMCEEHFKEHGLGIGTGYGQKLVEQLSPPERPAPMTVGAVLQSKRPTGYCGSCRDAAEEEGAPDDDESIGLILSEMGADIADHDCDGNCRCACRRG